MSRLCVISGATFAVAGALTFHIKSKTAVVFSDDMQTWDERWKSGNISFHIQQVNTSLSKYLGLLMEDGISSPKVVKRVLVPLCGKTVDMIFLQNLGHKVVGVDGVRKAADEFIRDNELTSDPPSTSSPGLEILELHRRGHAGHPIRFVVGDFFKMRPDVAGTFESGSFVAIDPARRPEYVAAVSALLDR
eukprot:CAMPEP_0172151824 /NCGR_PEP_ID=MMETSP1050-20130122/463_1 /TAXON_ID=233186 /ORGANISM="Cryptomonas curvata, Strain CCAP979/52" /LENGTH=189 /DNA_ID=CAMNT_0012820011 /DNA_START=82 /DNA_END=648 /DNA_ORIENTATION=-